MSSNQPQKLDFDVMLEKHTQANFKDLTILSHSFLFSCIHPTQEDVIICLERNEYPKELKTYNLREVKDKDGGDDEEVKEQPYKKQLSFGYSLKNDGKLDDSLSQQHQSHTNIYQNASGRPDGKQGAKNNANDDPINLSQIEITKDDKTKKTDIQSKLMNKVGLAGLKKQEEEKKEEGVPEEPAWFEFEEPQTFQEEEEITKSDYKYAISFWKTNKGRHPLQIKEYGFNGSPSDSKFFISHCGKYVYFFLSIVESDDQQVVKKLVILNSKDLTEHQVLILPKLEIPEDGQLSQVIDSALIRDGTLLYLTNDSHAYNFFVSVPGMKVVWHFDKDHDVQDENKKDVTDDKIKDKKNESDNSGSENDYDDESENIHEIIKVLFNVAEKDSIYTLSIKKGKLTQLHKVKIDSDPSTFFVSENLIWETEFVEDFYFYNDKVHYTKDLSTIILCESSTTFIFECEELGKPLKTRKFQQNNIEGPKFSFLHSDIWLVWQDEFYDVFVGQVKSLGQKLELDKIEPSYEKSKFDCRMTTKGDLLVVGQGESEKMININFIEAENVTFNVIRELSTIKCVYPYIFYCKGNSELVFQTLNSRDKLFKLALQDFFLCFVEINQRFQIGNDSSNRVRENEHIAFLSQQDGKIYLNIFQYNQFEKKINYKLIRSKLFIKRKDLSYGSIIKAVVIGADRKDVKGGNDFVLVIQYRTQIIIKSFLNKFQHVIEKQSMLPLPMIYKPNTGSLWFDYLYFLVKEGQVVKIQRVYFQQSVKDYIASIYELKTAKVNAFTINEDKLFIVDDSLLVKELSLSADEGAVKVQHNETYAFGAGARQYVKIKEFEEVFISSKALYQGYFFYPLLPISEISAQSDIYTWQNFYSQSSQVGDVVNLPQINGVMLQLENYKNQRTEEENEKKNEQSIAFPDSVDDGQNNVQIIIEPTAGQKANSRKSSKANETFNSGIDEYIGSERNGDGGAHKNQILSITPNKISQNIADKVSQYAIQQQYMEGKKLYDEFDTSENSTMSVVIVPYVDAKQLSILPTTVNSKNVQMSTFIDNKNNILLRVENKYFVYSKFGLLISQVDFKKKNDPIEIERKLLYISDNLLHYLFFAESNGQNANFEVFSLNQDDKGTFNFNHQKDVSCKHYRSGYDLGFDTLSSPTVDNDGNVYYAFSQSEENLHGGDKSDDEHDISSDRQFGNKQVQQKQVKKYPFKVYKNEEEIKIDWDDKYEIIEERSKAPDLSYQLQYAFIGDYLFLISGNKIEYLQIFNNINLNKLYAETLNLQLDENVSISRLVHTSRPHLVQLILNDEVANSMYIATWDLLTNIEHQMIQLEGLGKSNPERKVVRGQKQKLNYIITEDSFYDLQFQLPFTFFKEQEPQYGTDRDTYYPVNECKLSADNSLYLGVGQMNDIIQQVSLFDYYYWQCIRSYKPEQITPGMIRLEYFRPCFEGLTIFHEYVLDYKTFHLFYDEIKKIRTNEDKNFDQHLFFQAIIPNKEGLSPFDIAVKSKSPKSIELMLTMFIDLAEFRFSKFLRKHFNELLSMNLCIFEKYLDTCMFKHACMKQTKAIKWVFSKDEAIVDYHTSYMGEQFFEKLLNFKKSKQKIPMPSQLRRQKTKRSKSGPKFEELNKDTELMSPLKAVEREALPQPIEDEMELYDDKKVIDSVDNDVKRIEITALEFDWIFHGDSSVKFIKMLANTEDDNLFALETVRIIVTFLWQKFFHRILKIFFFPFLLYMTSFCVYVTYIFTKQFQETENDSYRKLDYFFVSAVLLGVTYFSFLESIQIKQQKMNYFLNFWNLVDLSSFVLNVAFVICDLTNVDPEVMRPLGAIAVLLMYNKFFYFLRLFQPTANLIRLIMETCKDVATFSFVFTVAIIGFGNTFYVLAVNTTGSFEGDLFTGDTFLNALIYSYRAGLGDFDTDGIVAMENQPTQTITWLVFLTETIVINIILLSMLIAIMADTFNKVTALGDKAKLKEICAMMSENETILDRKKTFANSKYIIHVKVEQADSDGSGSWEGQVGSLKAYIKDMMSGVKGDTKQIINDLRDEISINLKAIESKLVEGDNHNDKLDQQNALLLKDVKNLTTLLTRQTEETQKLRELVTANQLASSAAEKIAPIANFNNGQNLIQY